MGQVIAMIISDQVIEIFVYIWVVVTDDELLIITVLWEDFSLLRAVYILFTHSDSIVETFSGRSCVCVTGHQSVECVHIMMWWSSNLQ